MALIVSTHRF